MSADLIVPRELPLLEALSWSDVEWRGLDPADMLRRYERGARHIGVLADLAGPERTFVRALIARYGSFLDVPP